MIDDFAYENNVRITKKLSVFEFSFVTFAMNPNAIVNDMKSAKLDTVRDDHKHADGQTRPIGQPFNVGGELLMYRVTRKAARLMLLIADVY